MTKYVDLDRRKSIHVKLFTETHAGFRVELVKRRLSMQEVFEDFAQSVVAGSGHALRRLDKIVENKRSKEIQRLSSTDVDSLFDIIEDNFEIDGD